MASHRRHTGTPTATPTGTPPRTPPVGTPSARTPSVGSAGAPPIARPAPPLGPDPDPGPGPGPGPGPSTNPDPNPGLAPTPPEDPHAAALAHALQAAERGYPVIPLTRNKLPALRSPHRGHPEVPPCRGECGRLGHGVHDASTDPLTVRRMFAAAPWATGYGLACGRPPHHLIGIDLDTKNGADGLTALRFLAEQHDFPIPPTVTVLTPSGGRHLWLTGPPSPTVTNSVGRLAPGIDVRGAGGYLVGPGSLTARGRYALAPGTPHHPAPVPDTLLALLTAPSASTRREPPYGAPPQPAAALVRFVRASPVGQRNARLYWAACRADDSGLAQELAARLTEAARHTGLSTQEARATIASATRRRQNSPIP
ncbi:bifunctional DNA primase/polymerase [Streptomyces angustmyceticus]|uniref:DNA primase n=1 Tax=Streptomyces angustmyceticus TaxID=285578 RepID=A0A5J4LE61_9ACTN|nr:bifunctional DNA primase/polymerase [Streptomyces angustmyceticus]UAL68028.1 bifunctional DNA primase/polymerase [Streptomyces angustmyceticus]GES30804.1 DNA primase [Streptomyces angustmyceticus]